MERAEEASATSPRPPRAEPTRLIIVAIAALFIFPFLAQSGIWDPYELDAADLARRIAVNTYHAGELALPNANNALPTLSDLKMGELPFTSMALGFKLFGLHDWTGRLPLAIWGLFGVIALHEFLTRFVDRRAGFYGALALATMPLYFMQARTMLGDIVTMVALTFGFTGLAGALLEGEDEIGRRALWLLLGLLGLVAGYFSRGLFFGVAVPALSVGLAWVVVRGAGEGRGDPARDVLGAGTLLVGLVSLGIGAYILSRAQPDLPLKRALGFALLKKIPNEATFDLCVRQLGHALFPWSAFLPFAIGRMFRAPSGARLPEQEMFVRVALLVGAAVAYGTFALLAPFIGQIPFPAPALLAGIAAIAVLDLERGAPPSKVIALGCVVLGAVLFADIAHDSDKAMAAFVVERPQFPKSFEVQGGRQMALVLLAFAGLVALVWWEAQPRDAEERATSWINAQIDAYQRGFAEIAGVWNGNLLFGLIVVEAALVGLGAMLFIGRRARWGPVDKLPENFAFYGVNIWWALPLAVAMVPLLAFRRGLLLHGFRILVAWSRASRASFTLIAALLAGAAQSFWFYPALASQLSPKEVFDAYARQHKNGEPLALLGVRARAAAYYSGGEVTSFTDVNQAFAWLTERPGERRWMVVKADDLPRLNSLYRAASATEHGAPPPPPEASASARTEGQVWHPPSGQQMPEFARNLPVLDGRSSQILLVSNQLGNHENESWIGKIVLDTPPRPTVPIDIAFEDQLEAFGWEVADKSGRVMSSVVPQTAYHLRIYYRVLRPISGSWKAFVHIDGQQRRFNGDHNVLDGKYAMSLWQPGDVIVDDLDFQLEPNFTPGDYMVYFGFFTGETRFRVTRGPQNDNRAIAGAIHVR